MATVPNIFFFILKRKKHVGVLLQDKVGVKKAYRKVRNILENALFVTTPPNSKKMHSKSEK